MHYKAIRGVLLSLTLFALTSAALFASQGVFPANGFAATLNTTTVVTTSTAISTTTSATIASSATSATPCVSIERDLTRGVADSETDDSVSDLQSFLAAKKYLETNPTGYFGPMTLRAVKNFQKENKIIQTGYVGPLTRSVIAKLTCDSGAANSAVLRGIISSGVTTVPVVVPKATSTASSAGAGTNLSPSAASLFAGVGGDSGGGSSGASGGSSGGSAGGSGGGTGNPSSLNGSDISNQNDPRTTLLSPNAGELIIGATTELTFNVVNAADKVATINIIQYESTTSTKTLMTGSLATTTIPNSSLTAITVPIVTPVWVMPGSNYRLHICVDQSTTGSCLAEDTSDSFFTVNRAAGAYSDAEILVHLERWIRQNPRSFLNPPLGNDKDLDFDNNNRIDLSDEIALRIVHNQPTEKFETIYAKMMHAVSIRIGLTAATDAGATVDTRFVDAFDVDRDGTITTADQIAIAKALIGERAGYQAPVVLDAGKDHLFKLPAKYMALKDLNLHDNAGFISGESPVTADLLMSLNPEGRGHSTFFYFQDAASTTAHGWLSAAYDIASKTAGTEYAWIRKLPANKAGKEMIWKMPAGTIYYGSSDNEDVKTKWLNDLYRAYPNLENPGDDIKNPPPVIDGGTSPTVLNIFDANDTPGDSFSFSLTDAAGKVVALNNFKFPYIALGDYKGTFTHKGRDNSTPDTGSFTINVSREGYLVERMVINGRDEDTSVLITRASDGNIKLLFSEVSSQKKGEFRIELQKNKVPVLVEEVFNLGLGYFLNSGVGDYSAIIYEVDSSDPIIKIGLNVTADVFTVKEIPGVSDDHVRTHEDILSLVKRYGGTISGQPGFDADFDVNDDGSVSDSDVSIVRALSVVADAQFKKVEYKFTHAIASRIGLVAANASFIAGLDTDYDGAITEDDKRSMQRFFLHLRNTKPVPMTDEEMYIALPHAVRLNLHSFFNPPVGDDKDFDFNDDNQVDITDISAIKMAIGNPSAPYFDQIIIKIGHAFDIRYATKPGDALYIDQFDVNRDGIITGFDKLRTISFIKGMVMAEFNPESGSNISGPILTAVTANVPMTDRAVAVPTMEATEEAVNNFEIAAKEQLTEAAPVVQSESPAPSSESETTPTPSIEDASAPAPEASVVAAETAPVAQELTTNQ